MQQALPLRLRLARNGHHARGLGLAKLFRQLLKVHQYKLKLRFHHRKLHRLLLSRQWRTFLRCNLWNRTRVQMAPTDHWCSPDWQSCHQEQCISHWIRTFYISTLSTLKWLSRLRCIRSHWSVNCRLRKFQLPFWRNRKCVPNPQGRDRARKHDDHVAHNGCCSFGRCIINECNWASGKSGNVLQLWKSIWNLDE